MGYFIEPGHYAILMMTPAEYRREIMSKSGKQAAGWPIYFSASRAGSAISAVINKLTIDHALGLIQDNMNAWISMDFTLARRFREAGPTGDVSFLREAIMDHQDLLFDLKRAGHIAGIGGGLAMAVEQFTSTGQLMYSYKPLMYHTAVTPRMRRYWNKLYQPNWPDMGTAYAWYRRGQYSRDEVIDAGKMDGWSSEMIEKFLYVFPRWPSPREAFYLWMKDTMTKDEMLQIFKWADWPEKYWPAMIDNYYYTPTLYDLTRIADEVELDMTWATKQMRRRGIRPEDIPRIWRYLQMRPLKDEIAKIIAEILSWRQMGYLSHDQLDNYLKEESDQLGVLAKERELLNKLGDLKYDRELMEEQISIYTNRYRMAWDTAEDFLANLVAAGVQEVKANLMVEEQESLGYPGY